ncbi:MAG TPA: magnesium-translocating P-type ATPase [Chitinophagaceae bacterium]|nr:magnesium-translocating P-type ATPase [Chitinophagaceae bacterium]
MATQNTFWKDNIDVWYQQLNSSANGLTNETAGIILKKTGHQKRKVSHFEKDIRLFFGQFRSPLMLLLIAAVILSGVLGETSDVFIISFIILSTTLMSFFQERNAGRVVEKLQSIIAIKSTLLRNGLPVDLPADNIVPGDILLFKAGDVVPADCLLIESNEIHTNEASLTGESFPISKEVGTVDEKTPLAKRSNCLWEGSSIVSGTGKALVIQTGINTVFGNIAQSATTSIETSFEKGIKRFGYLLMKITLILSIFILVVNLLFQRPLIDSLLFALALAVGMAPELLPAINTIAMSAGAKRMLKKKVIVKKLSSIQNLGEVNLLCTDKTGTITEGAIVVSGVYDATGKESDFVKQLAFLNAQLESGYANPMDEALRKLNVSLPSEPKKLGEIPYDFTRKCLGIAVATGTEKLLITKGAFKNILDVCTSVRINDTTTETIQNHLETIQAIFEQYGENGFRAIGVCYKKITADTIAKDDEKEMIFAGFVTLQDPIKAGIIDALNKLGTLQVGIKIITGDNKTVAASIGKGIGIPNPNILTGEEVDTISTEALQLRALSTHIFAEVEPRQKERIIQALRKNFTVAYMGDGINDVGAINAADVGISVDNATDVAREAADFVLLEKNLMVLADGIREGRKTFANTLKYIFINTGATFGNMFSVAAASLLLPFLPMLPKQILLTNFLTDFPYLSVASDNVDEEQLDRPGKWNMKLIRNYMVFFGIHSSLFDLITFLTLLYLLKVKESTFQTGWFIESVLTELFILFIIRTRKSFIKSLPGKYLFLLSALALVLTIVLPYLPFGPDLGLVPLTPIVLLAMLGIVVLYILTADLLKIWFFRKFINPN